MTDTILEQINISGVSYANYKTKIDTILTTTDSNTLSADALEKFNFTKLNQTRIKRIDRTYVPGQEITEAIQKISTKQTWLFLTAVWCGDSAQNIPQLVKMAELNPLIKVRLIERDENLEIMDQFLTDGKRSIPKLIALNEAGEIIFTWGSRPAAAQLVVRTAINSGVEKKIWEEQLHLWYSRNRGKDLEEEMIKIVTDPI